MKEYPTTGTAVADQRNAPPPPSAPSTKKNRSSATSRSAPACFHIEPEGLRLHAILDAFGRELWTQSPPLAAAAVPPELHGYRTRDNHDWEDVVAQVEYVLTSALAAAPPRSWWEPVGEHIDTSVRLNGVPLYWPSPAADPDPVNEPPTKPLHSNETE